MDKGQRIKKVRKDAGLTQLELAKRLCVTKGAVSHWENGVAVASAEYYLAIADITGYSYRWLITGTPPERISKIEMTDGRKRYLESCDIAELKDILRLATDRLTSSV